MVLAVLEVLMVRLFEPVVMTGSVLLCEPVSTITAPVLAKFTVLVPAFKIKFELFPRKSSTVPVPEIV